jgi:flagellar biosynthesis activator protein FlaF
MSSPRINYAGEAYEKITWETANPRDLEANLLLTAAARLQAVYDSWKDKPAGLHEALMYHRRLWIVFIDAVTWDDNKLPATVRENLTRLGIMWIMAETFSLMSKPMPDHLRNIIKINRGIATGLRAKS